MLLGPAVPREFAGLELLIVTACAFNLDSHEVSTQAKCGAGVEAVPRIKAPAQLLVLSALGCWKIEERKKPLGS
jgi:hypothetical protein